jgi:uncharacterized membrane protein
MKWLFRTTYLYLLLPFMIFCMGWMRLIIALPILAIVLWVFWRLWKNTDSFDETGSTHITISGIVLTGLWVFLSGVGGYAFQNWDHHWRNAVLRDLITYDWPVIYSSSEGGPVKMLVYYVGYWLPSALAGKLFGWKFANFILFLWTWLGVLLAVLHLKSKIKASLFKTTLLLIFFSGMDALGALFLKSDYPTLWPPIQHLEIWAGDLQYSSFTTQLFWVFNQAVPAWLCIALILKNDVTARRVLSLAPPARAGVPTKQSPTQEEISSSGQSAPERPRNTCTARKCRCDTKFLIWALCFFYAPLASIGLLPYLLVDWFEHSRTNIKDHLKDIRVDLFVASAGIVIVSYLFFSSNSAAQQRGFQSLALKDFLMFFLLEGGILWLLLVPRLWRDSRWIVTGLLLFLLPFIQFGSGRDFVMRASIAPLFYLMMCSGEVIFQNVTTCFYRIAITAVLIIGAFTPLYEINRSIYRTFEYYFLLDDSQRVSPISGPVTHLEQGGAPELEHPGSLVADDIQTLEFMTDKLSKNFIANVRQSLYYRFLAAH